MHDEHLIPVFRLIPGSKKNKHPVYVMSNGPGLLSGLYLRLFRIELGSDGSLYTGAETNATEISRGEGVVCADGSVRFIYADEVVLPLDAAKKHEYVSFHSSGKINHPAKDQMPMPEMVFKLDDSLVGTQMLCHHLIGPPGIYQPSAPPRSAADMFFAGLYGAYPNAERIPYFSVDVSRYDGDPEPILRECGKDECISFGLLTDPITPFGRRGVECQFFIRVKLLTAPSADANAWPDGHRIVHAQKT